MRHVSIAITADSIIDRVVSDHPETVQIFSQLHMHCVGCPVARFESLADACDIYQLPMERFLSQLRAVIRQTHVADSNEGLAERLD